MGFSDFLKSLSNSSSATQSSDSMQMRSGLIDYGKNKQDGSHDHRTSKGGDRTPAQKKGDAARRKISSID